jgi:RNA polymerase sigma-70 factor (ECF subfamily)
MCRSPESAADVVQETFFTLIRHCRKYDQEKGAPAAFLFGIARNHLRKLHEKEARYVHLSDECDQGHTKGGSGHSGFANGNGHHPMMLGNAEPVLDGLERGQVAGLLREAILTLPEHYREPVTLCDLEGKSYSEAATLLECPVGTVRSRLNRARSMLLDKLRPARMGARADWAGSGGKE